MHMHNNTKIKQTAAFQTLTLTSAEDDVLMPEHVMELLMKSEAFQVGGRTGLVWRGPCVAWRGVVLQGLA